MSETQIRTYHTKDVVRFRKTTEEFGGLSNMAPGFPIVVLGHRIRTSEALYQACRFPHLPEVQKMILSEGSPMTAKMRSKPFRKDSRPDWDDVRVKVMKWCLRVKLVYNWRKFSELLLSTGDRPIVEDSRKDGYWGAMPQDADTLNGQNVLGRLLMDLRRKLQEDPEALRSIPPLQIRNFLLLGEPIPMIMSPRQQEVALVRSDDEGPAQHAFL
ncbi:NADAR family protein [Sphingomonas cavernae]|uniref:NADAR family protein n=1 Tax=Sphingomonas cavernae TaxID=2320861 RepID=A0A418WQJ5_9SPHN|nr:NADAR family protein [Sphingomonas cavernae]RJF93481.1 NADAR family protein [Sphingomonas cavernae]